ncbi:MAG: helix-turn-helix domain-containing protein [Mycobacteriales bacterium]
MSLPPFDPATGCLPPGEHEAGWGEVVERFGWNRRRRQLLDGLADALGMLARAGCARAWLNGSFVTAKEEPGDFDVVLDLASVDLERLDPVFFEFADCRLLQGHCCDRPEEDRIVITNEVQYRATKAHLARFDEAIANREACRDLGVGERRRRDLELAALRSQAADLRAEADEYELLRSGSVTAFEAPSLPELAGALVKARIAKGWTQRRLADELGVAEQQIQRYEATGYASASLARLCDVAVALGAEVREVVTLGTDAA